MRKFKVTLSNGNEEKVMNVETSAKSRRDFWMELQALAKAEGYRRVLLVEQVK